jgi:hypothetical protein
MRAFILICSACDARVPLGGNDDATNPRLIAAIKSGWHVEPRGKDFCPDCWKRTQTDRQPARPI